ncbi:MULTISPECIES: hypothetical protein [unclassified Rubrivivax]|uniref:hypothetical protein n=1 Tax=unclassified Rubrivivax TaxID=2649762 RepID=UPI001E5F53FE|nr:MULTISPECIES: hypothetical protein [unclassified Rubrivivax]MCC9597768.1 hypothetical protein [Rubrivivax sp. JA1055]MCC9645975.1 hypothetical protein [Rubrivivax sp. JA1029]
MGRKSREKRERRLANNIKHPEPPPRQITSLNKLTGDQKRTRDIFTEQVRKTRDLLRQYDAADVAIAIGVSELWPPNAGSPVKHALAWCVFLDTPLKGRGGKKINNYAEFREFSEALYETWPKFPTLEDFSPEADWGQIKVRLGGRFVPVLYGSSIERVPDFIEAFRITYADVPNALAQMDLVIALQALIIEAIPHLPQSPVVDAEHGHIELAPEDFWLSCTDILRKIDQRTTARRHRAGSSLDAKIGNYEAPLTWESFGNAAFTGDAAPFLGVNISGNWYPMAVRSGPGTVIDYWAKTKTAGLSPEVHRRLGLFIFERFEGTLPGPVMLTLGSEVCREIHFSSVTSTATGVYLVCACHHEQLDNQAAMAAAIIAKAKKAKDVRFKLVEGPEVLLSKDGINCASADELHIILAPTLAATSAELLNLPDKPLRLLPLADLITIFDSLEKLDDLQRYWAFCDRQRSALTAFSSGPADLFASFIDTNEVLVDGAIEPTMISLDPSWGTSWRFKSLSDFWSRAPRLFPDHTTAWRLSEGTEGVIEMSARGQKIVAYSTLIGDCTVQALLEIENDLRLEDGRMVDLFIQILADSTFRCRELLADAPLFHLDHVLFVCKRNPSNTIVGGDEENRCKSNNSAPIIAAAEGSHGRTAVVYLEINVRSVRDGLTDATDGRFEMQCLAETIRKSHDAIGMVLPEGLDQAVISAAGKLARYTLRVVTRSADVPEDPSPVIPRLSDYKVARKQLAKIIRDLGIAPGRYAPLDAKQKIDIASAEFRDRIERRLAQLDRLQLIRACIEQHDALLATERARIERARLSLSHEVDYDRVGAVEDARQQYGTIARHYRYLLEKSVSSQTSGPGEVTHDVLRELIGKVDWLMTLAGASDVLHNGVDVAGITISDSFIPEVFYPDDSNDREVRFAREYAKMRLGLGENPQDSVEGESEALLGSIDFNSAFEADIGFNLSDLITSLAVLTHAQHYGFSKDLSLSYAAKPEELVEKLSAEIKDLGKEKAQRIIAFLTLSESGIFRLAGRDVNEVEVPYWEHSKRVHRYAIRPLVKVGAELRWGAEAVSRCSFNWMSSVRDGYLPADFGWPRIEAAVRQVKAGIERRLEFRGEEIFRRHTPFVEHSVDFYRRFRAEKFEDVGDFDVLAYWPDHNLLVAIECKYNQPAYTMKDGRRLRDKIFGRKDDNKGQIRKVLRRSSFLLQNRARILQLLRWPKPANGPERYVELYVSRDIYYWMFHPPYPVSTHFVKISTLDYWLKNELFRAAGLP